MDEAGARMAVAAATPATPMILRPDADPTCARNSPDDRDRRDHRGPSGPLHDVPRAAHAHLLGLDDNSPYFNLSSHYLEVRILSSTSSST